ncbi:MAG: hypothetical protein XXXJIFNMEKO3_03194 [Candidatus Erwinia impunctatus]|nr:hypothetical protein XXXJIFNMEKO_03194 [Culicoides impunctatus]
MFDDALAVNDRGQEDLTSGIHQVYSECPLQDVGEQVCVSAAH